MRNEVENEEDFQGSKKKKREEREKMIRSNWNLLPFLIQTKRKKKAETDSWQP